MLPFNDNVAPEPSVFILDRMACWYTCESNGNIIDGPFCDDPDNLPQILKVDVSKVDPVGFIKGIQDFIWLDVTSFLGNNTVSGQEIYALSYFVWRDGHRPLHDEESLEGELCAEIKINIPQFSNTPEGKIALLKSIEDELIYGDIGLSADDVEEGQEHLGLVRHFAHLFKRDAPITEVGKNHALPVLRI